MNRFRTPLLIALAVLGMGGSVAGAQAQGVAQVQQQQQQDAGARRGAWTPAERQARMEQHLARRAAQLHETLHITPGQEAAFQSYLASMRPRSLAHGTRADWQQLTAPQRFERRIAMQQQRVADMQARLPALNTFYSVLSPEQKRVFDQQSMHGGHHRWHGRHGQDGQQRQPAQQ